MKYNFINCINFTPISLFHLNYFKFYNQSFLNNFSIVYCSSNSLIYIFLPFFYSHLYCIIFILFTQSNVKIEIHKIVNPITTQRTLNLKLIFNNLIKHLIPYPNNPLQSQIQAHPPKIHGHDWSQIIHKHNRPKIIPALYLPPSQM